MPKPVYFDPDLLNTLGITSSEKKSFVVERTNWQVWIEDITTDDNNKTRKLFFKNLYEYKVADKFKFTIRVFESDKQCVKNQHTFDIENNKDVQVLDFDIPQIFMRISEDNTGEDPPAKRMRPMPKSVYFDPELSLWGTISSEKRTAFVDRFSWQVWIEVSVSDDGKKVRKLFIMNDFEYWNNTNQLTVWFNPHELDKYLAFFSPFFDSLFFGGFSETGKDEIELKEIDPAEFSVLLGIIYPTEKEIDASNVIFLLKLADRLQLKIVMKNCEKFLVDNIDSNTSLTLMDFLELADTYNLIETQGNCLYKIRTMKANESKKFRKENSARIEKLSRPMLNKIIQAI